jgi:hypothetical protein
VGALYSFLTGSKNWAIFLGEIWAFFDKICADLEKFGDSKRRKKVEQVDFR